MKKFDTKKYPIYVSFLNQLAKDLTKFYYAKLDKPFKITNKMKGKGYDPVTSSDKAFEKFIRSKISKKFPNHQIIGEEYGHKNTKSEFSWVIFFCGKMIQGIFKKFKISLAFRIRNQGNMNQFCKIAGK